MEGLGLFPPEKEEAAKSIALQMPWWIFSPMRLYSGHLIVERGKLGIEKNVL